MARTGMALGSLDAAAVGVLAMAYGRIAVVLLSCCCRIVSGVGNSIGGGLGLGAGTRCNWVGLITGC